MCVQGVFERSVQVFMRYIFMLYIRLNYKRRVFRKITCDRSALPLVKAKLLSLTFTILKGPPEKE